MKCSLCGIEVEGSPSGPIGLTVMTNVSTANVLRARMIYMPDGSLKMDPDWEKKEKELLDNFMAIFGFYDQRSKSSFEICGACLVERLKGSWRDRPALF